MTNNDTEPEFERPFRILCVNGGGVLGILPSRILEHMEVITGNKLSTMFDLVCGTSVGGLISGVIGSPEDIHITDAIDKLKNTKMFQSSFLRNMVTIGGILRPRIATKIRDAELQDLYGNTKLGDCKPHVLTVSYDLKSGRAKTFSTAKDPSIALTDAVKASAAVPTVWEPHVVNDAICIDGGIFSNNPMLYGITEALTTYGKTPDQIMIFSLGTGYLQDNLDKPTTSSNGLHLINQLIRTYVSSNTINSVTLTENLVKDMSRFVHLDFPLELKSFKFLSTKKNHVDRLEEVAKKVIIQNEGILNEFAKDLSESHGGSGRLAAKKHQDFPRYYTNI